MQSQLYQAFLEGSTLTLVQGPDAFWLEIPHGTQILTPRVGHWLFEWYGRGGYFSLEFPQLRMRVVGAIEALTTQQGRLDLSYRVTRVDTWPDDEVLTTEPLEGGTREASEPQRSAESEPVQPL